MQQSELKFEVYQDNRKEWRWTLRFRNGKLIVDSAESYKNIELCKTIIQLIKENVKDASVIFL